MNQKNMDTKKIRVPEDLYEKLKKLASKNERSLTGEIAYALRQHVERNMKTD